MSDGIKIKCQVLPNSVLHTCHTYATQQKLPVVLSIDLGKRNCAFWLGTSSNQQHCSDLSEVVLAFWAWGKIDCGAASMDTRTLNRAIERAFFVRLVSLTTLANDVVIEKQLRVNGPMKRMCGHIAKLMRLRGKRVTIRHAASKFITCANAFQMPHSFEKAQRKRIVDEACARYLASHKALSAWHAFFVAQNKRDDFADAFWQAMDHIVRRYSTLLLNKHGLQRIRYIVQHPNNVVKRKHRSPPKHHEEDITTHNNNTASTHHPFMPFSVSSLWADDNIVVKQGEGDISLCRPSSKRRMRLQ